MKFSNESLLISIDAVLDERMRLIYGEKVLLDFELAELLQVSTQKLLGMVKREKKRFPLDFMMRLSSPKYLKLLPPAEKRRRTVLAFTWGGLMMAAGQIRTKKAQMVSMKLIETYAGERRYHQASSEVRKQLAFIWFFDPDQ
jgi:hypothetical protein